MAVNGSGPRAAAALFLALSAVLLSCSEDTFEPAAGFDVAWETIDTFDDGGRITAVCGTGPGTVWCGYLGLIRMSDGWQVLPDGAVIAWDGARWSRPLRSLESKTYDIDMCSSPSGEIYVADGSLWSFDGSRWTDEGIAARAVCCTESGQGYAASMGDSNTVFRRGISSWIPIGRLGGERIVRAIWAAEGPVVAVALTDGVALWDGDSWTDFPFGGGLYVQDVWGSAPDDLYAVGYQSMYAGLMWHYDGTRWSTVSLPHVPRLNAVWGSGSGDIYAVGLEGAVVHYDGGSWEPVERMTSKHLWDVWGSDPDDVYVVGDDDKVLHYDGVSWKSIRKDKPGSDLLYFWAESKDRFSVINWLDKGTVYLYDGGEWEETVIDARHAMRTLAGRSLDDLFVLADRDVYHYDGTGWTYSAPLDADFPGTMWFPEEGGGYAIGGGALFRFTGTAWTPIVNMLPWVFTGIWGASADAIYVTHRENLIYHFDGDSWSTVPPPVEGEIGAVWGVSGTEVYFRIGTGLYRHDGLSWESLPAPASPFLGGLVLNAGDNMFAYGGCHLGHFDGRRWTEDCFPDDPPLMIVESLDGEILMMTPNRVAYQVR